MFTIQAYVFKFVKSNLKSLDLQLEYILYCVSACKVCVCMRAHCYSCLSVCVSMHSCWYSYIFCVLSGEKLNPASHLLLFHLLSCYLMAKSHQPAAIFSTRERERGREKWQRNKRKAKDKESEGKEIRRSNEKNQWAPSFCSSCFVSSFLALPFSTRWSFLQNRLPHRGWIC